MRRIDALVSFAGSPENPNQIEDEDQTLVDMDAIWEEEAVSFMATGDACHTRDVTISPVAILPREQFAA